MRRAVLTLTLTSALIGAAIGCSPSSSLDRSTPTTSELGSSPEEPLRDPRPVVPSPNDPEPYRPAPDDPASAARPLGLARCNPPPGRSTECVDVPLPVWPPHAEQG
jgi:hypothetical protein